MRAGFTVVSSFTVIIGHRMASGETMMVKLEVPSGALKSG